MKIINITSKNIDQFDHCLIKNRNLAGYKAKTDWMNSQFKDGLIVKRVLSDGGDTMGFIEYIPIENAWRAVDGSSWLFIHCIFSYPKKFQGMGVAKLLIDDVIRESQRLKLNGVAVMASKSSFIADKRVFEKYGFEVCDQHGKESLLVFKNKKSVPLPRFRDVTSKLKKCKGLHVYFSDQCPSLAKPVAEIKEECKTRGIDVKFHYIKSAKDAQNAPFLSGTFGIVRDGKIYAERVVSKTRFLNIIK